MNLDSGNLPPDETGPVFKDTEEFRQVAIHDIREQIKELKELIAAIDNPKDAAGLYMRLQNAWSMLGELMGVLKAGPPPGDPHQVIIHDVNTLALRPPDEA